MAQVWQDGKCGFIDKKGKVIISFQFDTADSFSEGLAKVKQNDKYGFVDKEGKVVVPFQFDDAGSFSDGLSYVEQDGKYGFVNKKGKVVIPFQFDAAFSFSEGLAQVWQDGKSGVVDKKGKIVIPCKYDKIYGFSDGLIMVKLENKYGFVNLQGIDTFTKQKEDYEEAKLQKESQNQISMVNNLIKDKATFKGYGANGYLIFSPCNEKGGRARIVITLASQYDYIYDITEDGRILLHDGTWYKGMSQPEKQIVGN